MAGRHGYDEELVDWPQPSADGYWLAASLLYSSVVFVLGAIFGASVYQFFLSP